MKISEISKLRSLGANISGIMRYRTELINRLQNFISTFIFIVINLITSLVVFINLFTLEIYFIIIVVPAFHYIQNFAMLCILCCKYANSCLNIFDENEIKLGIADIIGIHFWFKPIPEENISAVICSACWSKVDDFHQFYLSVKDANTNLNSKMKIEPSAEFDFIESLDHDLSPKEELTEEACPLGDKSLDHSNQIVNEFWEVEMPCCTSNEATHADNELANPFCELDSNKTLNDAICSNDESRDEIIPSLIEKGKTIRGRGICKKSKVAKKVAHKIHKEERTIKLRHRYVVKSKLEDDAMVKKYIPMICELCTFIGEDYSSVAKHFRKEHAKVKPYIRCCNKKLFLRQDIIHHAYRHDNPEFFKCKECQKVFAEQSTLSRHMITVHTPEEELNFCCDQCPKKFSRQEKLEIHRNSHVPMEERAFACDQCPNSRFATNELLKVHICARHRRAPNVCHVCAKEIRDKASFEKHVRAHFEDGAPKAKCPIENCNLWLKDEDYLRRHIRRAHTNQEKAVTCEICGGVYKNKYSLTVHKGRVHSNVVFTCEVCKKNFKRALYLREHMTQHTGEILYNCQFCTRTFNSNANMHAHKKKMHPVEWDNLRKANKNI
ncbi:transcription factor grauzone [Ceratitis capitata]|uniref:transcription factor grauzone n=1 Tax=Ceratitis capitata TaxID=7213 RepID=UPI0006188D0C|nr:transcription factor grauzone [Ceratitis capitata]